mgnify:CR=1 FL=1
MIYLLYLYSPVLLRRDVGTDKALSMKNKGQIEANISPLHRSVKQKKAESI